jgi:uncharacterized protein
MHESAPRSAPRDEMSTPWWRVGMVWLVLGGPLAVVVAGLVTAAIAVSGAEEVLTRPVPNPSAANAAQLPAMQGRNHAATPKH